MTKWLALCNASLHLSRQNSRLRQVRNTLCDRDSSITSWKVTTHGTTQWTGKYEYTAGKKITSKTLELTKHRIAQTSMTDLRPSVKTAWDKAADVSAIAIQQDSGKSAYSAVYWSISNTYSSSTGSLIRAVTNSWVKRPNPRRLHQQVTSIPTLMSWLRWKTLNQHYFFLPFDRIVTIRL